MRLDDRSEYVRKNGIALDGISNGLRTTPGALGRERRREKKIECNISCNKDNYNS